ncbi:redoxin domain-containing protein [Roseofilum casamattae]|uniref:Redoxin domain-containing protein n=1 Tax=Roseofilum casamattae BLCC-M143 TaxID=3022442 RepID=A0ABT7BVD7_9CYAN|nr:redoxin domain-containing protein [Roseofilum casamattae]MDJ1183163.1 redoxin domain-containing protein [Roseofilum casamattae BLCC-M143]
MTSLQLSVGDFAPAFIMPCQTGERLDSRRFQGEPMLWVFFPDITDTQSQTLLLGLQGLHEQLKPWNLEIMAISTDSVATLSQFSQDHNISFSLICDENGEIVQGLGLNRPELPSGEVKAKFTTFLIHSNYKIVQINTDFNIETYLDRLLDDLNHLLPRENPHHLRQIAPVLLIPNVLSRDFCRQLIEVWRTQGHGDSGFMVQRAGKTIGEFDYGHKIRKDHFVRDEQLINQLRYFIIRRVRPELLKAYYFDMTRFEDFRIACYESSRGGFFRRHRDNTTSGTAHRRFAMTLNLNTEEYEGGYLRFPEYGPHLYRPETGSAVIFSCSLLHEATDVTAGDRFALLSFFYGEKEAQLRDKTQQQKETASSNIS